MKKKTQDHDMPIGKLNRIKNFLPPPEKLFPKNDMKKITIVVDAETVSFFKEKAKQVKTKYQKMMREVLKGYARKYH